MAALRDNNLIQRLLPYSIRLPMAVDDPKYNEASHIMSEKYRVRLGDEYRDEHYDRNFHSDPLVALGIRPLPAGPIGYLKSTVKKTKKDGTEYYYTYERAVPISSKTRSKNISTHRTMILSKAVTEQFNQFNIEWLKGNIICIDAHDYNVFVKAFGAPDSYLIDTDKYGWLFLEEIKPFA